jgi:hypothetical protein
MLLYILIGMLFTMSIDLILVKTATENFTMGERLITILLWPIMLIYMIYELLK